MRQRDKAPQPTTPQFTAAHDAADAENWRLLERDLKENPHIWPLLSHVALK